MALTLMKGSEAIAEAAIRAGARFFFGYPITPQTEIPEYMSARMPEVGGCFLQAESEVAAINMVYGAASTGERVITSSSSPGVSLKQEGISYCAGAQLPCVILNVMRGGPGLGSIQASQGDYNQAVKGGGNGDYHLITYAPASIQEAIDIFSDCADHEEWRALIQLANISAAEKDDEKATRLYALACAKDADNACSSFGHFLLKRNETLLGLFYLERAWNEKRDYQALTALCLKAAELPPSVFSPAHLEKLRQDAKTYRHGLLSRSRKTKPQRNNAR